jgi:hypothetical protein
MITKNRIPPDYSLGPSGTVIEVLVLGFTTSKKSPRWMNSGFFIYTGGTSESLNECRRVLAKNIKF